MERATGAVATKPMIEFDGSEDQSVHRTAAAAVADAPDDQEKVCCVCGEPMEIERVVLRMKRGYDEQINYAHMSCIKERLKHNGEN